MATSNHLLLFLLLTATTVVSSPAYDLPSQHADRIIEAMIGAGDLREWAADFLSSVDDQFGIPLSATIFIPSDFDPTDISSSITGSASGRQSVAYHIVPQRLSFADLRLLEPLSRLPTLLPGHSIVVTNNSVSGFTLDGVLVSEPDLFLSSSIAIHGVASPLDLSRYGDTHALPDTLRPWSNDLSPSPGFNIDDISASLSIAHLSTSSFLLPWALVLF
ncbi:unnamed protein product [Microthlaspi erraticum]|uniref:FAS1 domain-containing protein n=1 Tax=Microthlaspi erraticum TaxID=1685480 RepID=A0A6D2HWV6_9BRAS|nr:unnamed protein product [Microthlaspi erraticum]